MIAIPTAMVVFAASAVLGSLAIVTGQQTTPAGPAAPSPLTERWSHEVAAPGTPFVAAGPGQVFVGGPEAGLSAFSRDDGTQTWTSSVAVVVSPAAKGTVVAAVSASDVRMLEADSGRPLWSRALPTSPPSGLAFLEELLVVTAGSRLTAWHQDGDEAWQTDLPAIATTRVVAAEAFLIVGLESRVLAGIDRVSGRLSWTLPLTGVPKVLTASGSRVFTGTDDRALYGLRLSGSLEQRWRSARHAETIGEPVANDRTVYFTFVDNAVKALDANGGSQRWTRQLPARPVIGSVLNSGHVLLALRSAEIGAIVSTTGRWAGTPPERLSTTRLVPAAAAAPDGSEIYMLSVASDNRRSLTAWRFAPAPPP